MQKESVDAGHRDYRLGVFGVLFSCCGGLDDFGDLRERIEKGRGARVGAIRNRTVDK